MMNAPLGLFWFWATTLPTSEVQVQCSGIRAPNLRRDKGGFPPASCSIVNLWFYLTVGFRHMANLMQKLINSGINILV